MFRPDDVLILLPGGVGEERPFTSALTAHFPFSATLDPVSGEPVSALGIWRIESARDLLTAMPPETLARVRFIFGRIPYGVHAFLPRPARYVMIVRNPVDRILAGHASGRAAQGLAPDPALLEANFARGHNPGHDNPLTRALSGRGDLNPTIEQMQDGDWRRVDESDFAAARDTLRDGIEFCGVFERLAASALAFEAASGLPVAEAIVAARPPKAAFDAETCPAHLVAEIRRRNRFDLELYEIVQRRLDERRGTA